MEPTYPATATTPPMSVRNDATWLNRFILVALLGIGLVALANLITFFSIIGDLPDDMVAPMVFWTFGTIAIGLGLGLAGALARGALSGVRVALLIAGAYFIISAGMVGAFTGAFGALSGF